ncbi:TPA: WxL domain-containing protein [Enterococcus faecalis]|uniref:WxL domain-containing protein n=2 Tax=Enterococcus faecalis TaxID=1351 RepID=UPI0019ED30F9|nr:WxL domain-containing protein [Enterococcus faecalis]EGO2618334.1 WxL domain-containing protein [Enterococcus faecalis]EGO5179649.1 WxL domain-containing protein [Enterococcus faecalis]EGO8340478.1 WxL domain-containing protein [Enterococcus faecalis]EGO8868117.1 WxL domain-containing protein [Enterococcus faecalis]EGO8928353.1 WxL domain-containing protein [Enterococcus faecalis]
MKQTKWQRLATIGLCSSLVINAFSGVTAVAETITIESSPTVASSAKEATSASSATQASTESSQETTETSREEVTQETEKPEEITKTSDSKIDMIDPLNNSLQNSPTVSPKATVAIPSQVMDFAIVDEENNGVALTTPITGDSQWVRTGGVNGLVGSVQSVRYSTAYAGKNVFFNRITIPGVNYSNTVNFAYGLRNVTITLPKWYKGLSFVKPSYSIYPASYISRYDNNGQTQVGWWKMSSDSALGQSMHVIAQPNVYQVKHGLDEVGLATASFSFNAVYRVGSIANKTYTKYNIGPDALTNNYNIIYMYTTKRKVTENFVDVNGIKITPPSGFTQGKQTVINSDPYTFKQSGTLPETYKASNGKTYKFKGWYKGKTKPNTLTTTKAPSYAVTYDDNDDLNVVYEEIEAFDFPALTYQFGFVDESGKRVDASTIGLTYDKWRGELLTNNVNDWKTVSLEKGRVAPTKNNLKEIAYPAQSLEIMSGRSSQYSAANLTFTPPRYYEKMSVYNKSGTFDAGYPFPNIQNNNSSEPSVEGLNKNLSSWFELKKSGNQSFVFNKPIPAAPIDVQVPAYLREIVYNPDLISNTAVYYVIDKPVYYYLTNRKVTENFVDTSGAKITAPTGFTQGKQTVINSDPYTFKQSGTLPDTYQADGKTYKFKGWYKGKVIPNTLTTTKAPSYAVTYDDNDDLNVVYEEETVTTLYPSINMNFVNEKGGAFTPALTFSGKYYAQSTSASLRTDLYDVTSKNNGSGQYTVSINNGSMPLSQELLKKYNNGQPISVTNRLRFNVDKLTINQQLKYVDGIQVDTAQSSSLNYYGHKYTSGSSMIFDPNIAPTEYNMTTEQINSLNFSSDGTYFSNANNRFFNMHLGYSSSGGSLLLMMALFNENPVNQPKLVYKVTRKQVTENFVDANGAKITAPTGFTQGNKIPMTSNTFKYTAAKALPATYTAGGKTYTFQGWYKGKTKPNTLTTSTTPTYNTTFDGNDDMTAMYKEEVPKASVALTRTTAETVTSGGNVTWRATITNTSQAPLTTATIKKSTAWTTGLAAPTAMIVTPAGGTAKTVPVTATTWTNGVSLGTDIPVGKSATVQFTTKATGTAGQVLRAGITTSGNYSGVSASATVRVKDNDQAIVTPTAEGFISVPTFNFGQVGVAGSTQQHSLKKAADYYGNGTRNPYLRIKKTQPNWSLTAQLSQPKSATDSLPTATRLLLGAAPVSSFSNYNQPTELKNAVGTTSAISLNANNTATRIIANQQFTGSNIYQLDFTFNNVKLEVPANQGVKGQQYQAAVTWNLVTGP